MLVTHNMSILYQHTVSPFVTQHLLLYSPRDPGHAWPGHPKVDLESGLQSKLMDATLFGSWSLLFALRSLLFAIPLLLCSQFNTVNSSLHCFEIYDYGSQRSHHKESNNVASSDTGLKVQVALCFRNRCTISVSHVPVLVFHVRVYNFLLL